MGYSSKNTIDGKSMRKMRAVMSHSSLAPTSGQRSPRHKNHALIDSFISALPYEKLIQSMLELKAIGKGL